MWRVNSKTFYDMIYTDLSICVAESIKKVEIAILPLI